MQTLWVIVMILNGVSIVGSAQYTTEDQCKEAAARNAMGYHLSCVPVYKGKSEVTPDFKCGDGEREITCQLNDMGGA